MKALREVRPPGVYYVGFESRPPLSTADAHIAGFVGLASKGPLDTPTKIRSWAEFIEVFGPPGEGHLARAVEGYFQNGGIGCYVVRVARRPRPGAPLTIEHAVPAERLIKDGWDKNTLRVLALNEGRWGNNIWVRFAQATGAKTLLTLDLPVGSGEARVNSTRGIEHGALLKIYDRTGSDYVIVTKVKDNTIYWDSNTPIMRSYEASAPTVVEVMEFEVHATLRDRREAFRHLQMSPLSRRYAPRVINEQSQLIRLVDLASPSPPPHNLPAVTPSEKLAGGRDGTDEYVDEAGERRWMSAEDFVGYDLGLNERTGLKTLEHVDEVGLLVVPDAMLAYSHMPVSDARRFVRRVYDEMIAVCERTSDRFALLDMPDTRSVEEVRQIRHGDVGRQKSEAPQISSYAAYYYPWLLVQTPDGKTVRVPPSGHVAGVYARCEIRTGVHKAPANEPLQGVTQLSVALTDDHIGQLNQDGVNTLRAFGAPPPGISLADATRPDERNPSHMVTGRGIRIWGARTLSSDPDWRYINVRRLFIMLRKSLIAGTQWVTFEPNTPSTWSVLTREISVFLRGLWSKGYFAGGSEEESFLVKCDEETNSPEIVDNGQLIMEIRVAPAVPAEYILFTLEQTMNEQGAGPV
jgi:hypothetical protein